VSSDDVFAEYDALVAKVDAAVAAIVDRAQDALACAAGCASCCVDGLSVVAVEAAALARYADDHDVDVDAGRDGHCVFLRADGRCAVYAARPLLCRTHGLPLRGGVDVDDAPAAPAASRALHVLNDVSVCALNFTNRAPAPSEVLDAGALQKLLVVVDARYRARVGLPPGAERVALRALLDGEPAG
jgi:hypothetical protein